MRTVKRIALFIDSAESEYTQRIVSGAAGYLKEQGMELIVFSAGGLGTREFSYDYQYLAVASHITMQNVDGIIYLATQKMIRSSQEFVRSYVKSFAPIPLVSIGYVADDIPCVLSDGRQSMRNLVDHLITRHQCRNIALLSVEGDSADATVRTESFMASLAAHGISFDPSKEIYGGFDRHTATTALLDYRKEHGGFDFDTVVALNDEMAFACLDVFAQEGVRVPQDIIVTGFDDGMRSICGIPSLTTINQGIEKQAAAAARQLCNILRGEPYNMRTIIPSRAVYRQSCGCIGLSDGFFKERNEQGELIMTENRSGSYGFAEWYIKRGQFVEVIRLYSDMQVDMTLDDFRNRINTDLTSLGINAAAVVLFENPLKTKRFEYFPLPDTALLFTAFDRDSGTLLRQSDEQLWFDPHRCMVPDGIFSSLDGMLVVSLFRNSSLFGYIVYRPGYYDISVYNMVCKMLSSTLASAYATTMSATARHELEEKYQEASAISVTDEMTGLLNRRGFISIGQKTLEVSAAMASSGMVLFGDIDGLKKINDTYGHAAGDTAIKAEAVLLKKTFRSADIIGRMGGDEFAIIAPGLNADGLSKLRGILEENCAEWNRKSGEKFVLSMSLGSTFYPGTTGENYNIKLLMEEADAALYEEKRRKHSLR